MAQPAMPAQPGYGQPQMEQPGYGQPAGPAQPGYGQPQMNQPGAPPGYQQAGAPGAPGGVYYLYSFEKKSDMYLLMPKCPMVWCT